MNNRLLKRLRRLLLVTAILLPLAFILMFVFGNVGSANACNPVHPECISDGNGGRPPPPPPPGDPPIINGGNGPPADPDPPAEAPCIPTTVCTECMCGDFDDGCGNIITCTACPPALEINFTANPQRIIRGQTSTLSWRSNANVCQGYCVSGPCAEWGPPLNRLPAPKDAPNGTQDVRPPTTATYRLECLSTCFRDYQDLTVRVDFIRWREVIPRPLLPLLDGMLAWVSGTRMQDAK